MSPRSALAGILVAASGAVGCSQPEVESSAGEACEPAAAPLGADAAQGHSFPDVDLSDCDGVRGTLAAVRCRNALTIVSIGAGWCAPCVQETPELQAAHQELAGEGIGVAQIVFQDAQAAPATTAYCKKWVDTFDLTFPVFVDPPGNTLEYFDSAVTPLNLMLDARGRVLWSEVGKVPEDLIGLARSLRPD